MQRPLFRRIVAEVMAHNAYFLQKHDAVGVLGLSSLQKITTAMRMLAYGQLADSTDEYIRISESTVLCCLRQFVKTVVDVGPQYLRAPNVTDISRLSLLEKQRDFLEMLGSIVCMHWK